MNAGEGTRLLKELKALGHQEPVRIGFSGGGDSGGIDSIEGIDEHHPLYESIQDWADEFCNELPCDWVNNEGGSGIIHMNLATGKISYEVSCYYTTSEVVESGEF